MSTVVKYINPKRFAEGKPDFLKFLISEPRDGDIDGMTVKLRTFRDASILAGIIER